MQRNQRLAELFEERARLMRELAHIDEQIADAIRHLTAMSAAPIDPATFTPPDRLPVGQRQLEIIQTLREVGPDGLITAEVARRTGQAKTATFNALVALERRGIVERINVSPQRWRIAELNRS